MSNIEDGRRFAMNQGRSRDERSANLRAQQLRSAENRRIALDSLCESIAKFQQEVGSKVRIRLDALPSSIRVSIGIHRLVGKPALDVLIEPDNANGYKLMYISPEARLSYLASQEQVITELKRYAAQYLSCHEMLNYSPPSWYFPIGRVLGAVGFICAWTILVASGNIWGFLLGWIPAILIYIVVRNLWIFCVIPAMYYLLR
jgi:hypothetical protein